MFLTQTAPARVPKWLPRRRLHSLEGLLPSFPPWLQWTWLPQHQHLGRISPLLNLHKRKKQTMHLPRRRSHQSCHFPSELFQTTKGQRSRPLHQSPCLQRATQHLLCLGIQPNQLVTLLNLQEQALLEQLALPNLRLRHFHSALVPIHLRIQLLQQLLCNPLSLRCLVQPQPQPQLRMLPSLFLVILVHSRLHPNLFRKQRK